MKLSKPFHNFLFREGVTVSSKIRDPGGYRFDTFCIWFGLFLSLALFVLLFGKIYGVFTATSVSVAVGKLLWMAVDSFLIWLNTSAAYTIWFTRKQREGA